MTTRKYPIPANDNIAPHRRRSGIYVSWALIFVVFCVLVFWLTSDADLITLFYRFF